ncbi:MAG: carbohydrate-binding domain-containing protein [Bifidobacteriaceae bacterium]|jgi:hypothetical protein|nr:carbohydrate-binding domain-containing protein [Bifidobacteriaceae bacterium]
MSINRTTRSTAVVERSQDGTPGRRWRLAGSLGLVVALAAALAPLFPQSAPAASSDTVIDLTDSSTMEGDGWRFLDGLFTILDGADVTVTGSTDEFRVIVASGATATVTLENATIDFSGSWSDTPFSVASGAAVTVKLSGVNTLKASGDKAALHVPAGASLYLTSAAGDGQYAGTLNAAMSNSEAAGIGGGFEEDAGVITIAGGTVNAVGGASAAGIGGGYGGSGGTISITGGLVTATAVASWDDPAAIGGGGLGGAGTITISGGVVVALAGENAAGIGGGSDSVAGSVTITGGTVISSAQGIGISSAAGLTDVTISGSPVILATAANGHTSNGAGGVLLGGAVAISTSEPYSLTLGADLVVPAGATLTAPPGWKLDLGTHTLEVAAGGTLDVLGELHVPSGGTLNNSGAVVVGDGATVTIEGLLTGAKLGGAPVSGPPVLASSTATSLTVAPVALGAQTGQTVEYAIAESPVTPSTWQAGTTWTGLTPGASYFVFARSADNSVFDAGAPLAAELATAATVGAALSGVVAPVAGVAAVSTIETDEYSGVVSWSPPPPAGVFAPGEAYTAEVVLTAKLGWTFEGVGEDSYQVDGASSVTNAADSGVVTVVFPATGATVDPVLSGLVAPVAGAVPVSSLETDEYEGVVVWSPRMVDGVFDPGQEYTARVLLTAKPGWTFVGVGANSYQVVGASSVENNADAGVLTVVFPATGSLDKTALDAVLDQARGITRTYQTTETWDALQAAILAGEAVSADVAASQPAITDAAAAIAGAIAALRHDYPVLAPFGVWSGEGDAAAQVDVDSAKLTRFVLDGVEVPAAEYSATGNPLVLTLPEAYLATLAPGEHDFYAEFSDGTAGPLALTVTAPAPSPSPSDPGSGTLPVTGGAALPPLVLAAVLLVTAGVLLRSRAYR